MVKTPDDPERYPLLRDVELTSEQRRWRPQTGHDLWFGVLPSKVEVLREQLPDGTMTASAVQLENDSEVPWDWRSVAFWRAALPESWQVQLSNPGRLTLVPAED